MAIRLVVLILYMIVLIGIGFYSSKRASSYEGFNLAGRGNNKWIGGISTQSASTSGWILLGLPGLAYVQGFGIFWTLVGWIGGSLINWIILAKRLRVASEEYDAVSCVEFFEKRVNDITGNISKISALTIVILMTINSSSELIGCGKMIMQVFGIDYSVAVTIGLAIVTIYTFLGGFLAVSWTNLLQGTLMFFALGIVPTIAIADLGGFNEMAEIVYNQDAFYFQFLSAKNNIWEVISLVSGGVGISLMYPGLIHALTSIMSIKDPNEVKDSGLIAIIWGVVALLGASAIGMAARAIFPVVDDPETVFLMLGDKYFSNAVFAVLGAAVLAAILSSVSSYLIVSASSIAASILKPALGEGKDGLVVRIQRILIIVIAVASYILAFKGGSLHTITMFASSGLGAAFGPLMVASLFSNKINKKGAFASIVVGLLTVLVWFYSGLSNYLFEVFPGVIASTITLFVVSKATGGPEQEVLNNYNEYITVYQEMNKVKQ